MPLKPALGVVCGMRGSLAVVGLGDVLGYLTGFCQIASLIPPSPIDHPPPSFPADPVRPPDPPNLPPRSCQPPAPPPPLIYLSSGAQHLFNY